MRPLTASELLDIWERGLSQSPLQRSLMLLSAAASEPIQAAAQLSIGRRDARLLSLREWAFGVQVMAVASCPDCEERLEVNFLTSDVRVGNNGESMEDLNFEMPDYRLRCRAPNSLDLHAVTNLSDPEAARRRLLERCVMEIAREDGTIPVEELPTHIVDTVIERIAQADPQADIRIAMSCPQCRADFQATFDIGPFFWNEIHAWAQRTLREVHMLASTYGWSESEILAMSPWRRQSYLSCLT